LSCWAKLRRLSRGKGLELLYDIALHGVGRVLGGVSLGYDIELNVISIDTCLQLFVQTFPYAFTPSDIGEEPPCDVAPFL